MKLRINKEIHKGKYTEEIVVKVRHAGDAKKLLELIPNAIKRGENILLKKDEVLNFLEGKNITINV